MRKPTGIVLVALSILAFALAVYGYVTWNSIGEEVTEDEMSAAEVVGVARKSLAATGENSVVVTPDSRTLDAAIEESLQVCMESLADALVDAAEKMRNY
jgi:Na+-transporting methylmalonyl-CoA/oxaloacetate decarboxylase gamma subunit